MESPETAAQGQGEAPPGAEQDPLASSELRAEVRQAAIEGRCSVVVQDSGVCGKVRPCPDHGTAREWASIGAEARSAGGGAVRELREKVAAARMESGEPSAAPAEVEEDDEQERAVTTAARILASGRPIPRLNDDPPHPATVVPDQTTEDAIRRLLISLRLDPDSEGLRDTPRRVARWWHEFMWAEQNGAVDTAFTAERVDELVLVRGIEVWSVCEHHLLPFRLNMTVGYITRERMLGLSKLARLAHEAARGPNVQERVSARTADLLTDATGTPDVAVVAEGLHLCMAMRGVRQGASTTTTSVMRGRFRHDPAARAEFLALGGYSR